MHRSLQQLSFAPSAAAVVMLHGSAITAWPQPEGPLYTDLEQGMVLATCPDKHSTVCMEWHKPCRPSWISALRKPGVSAHPLDGPGRLDAANGCAYCH